MKKVAKYLWATLVTVVLAGLIYYFMLPAISIHNPQLLVLICVLLAVYLLTLRICEGKRVEKLESVSLRDIRHWPVRVRVPVGVVAVCGLIYLIGLLWGAVFLRAADYRQLLGVKEGDFTTDVKEISYDQIPTLDLDSATKLGDRKMGELSDMVSQFNVLDNYTQINYKGVPTRVTPLGYADLFKWMGNMSSGIPAYISIDMVSQEVTVHRLEQGMKYTLDDHFNRYLMRHLRFRYPTYIFESPDFEIDENGTPWWVCSRIVYNIGLYGGRDIGGVVLVNAITGEDIYYDIADVPSWVDRAYNAEMIIEQYDYYGTLQKGFWNSIFGQKDCKQTTAGYNYIAINDDVYMYTGVTSLAADESNVGFILANQRTKETKFYAIPGAEEFSAMSSAEGEVQNLRYNATFPLLLNVAGEPTYFTALKDAAGLVKMYAFVNVQQYQIVGTGDTLKECEADYIAKLSSNDLLEEPQDTAQTVELSAKVSEIRSAVVEGNTKLYFTLEGQKQLFAIKVSANESLIALNVGDEIKVSFKETEGNLVELLSAEKIN